MRMVVTDQLRPSVARGLVRGYQCHRIDLEMARRIGVDIFTGLYRADYATPPQQQTAALLLTITQRLRGQCDQCATCYHDLHA